MVCNIKYLWEPRFEIRKEKINGKCQKGVCLKNQLLIFFFFQVIVNQEPKQIYESKQRMRATVGAAGSALEFDLRSRNASLEHASLAMTVIRFVLSKYLFIVSIFPYLLELFND